MGLVRYTEPVMVKSLPGLARQALRSGGGTVSPRFHTGIRHARLSAIAAPKMSDADRGITRQIALTDKRASAPTRSMSLNRPPGRVRHQIVRRTSANRARTDPQNSPTAWSQRRFTRTPASPCASRRRTRSLIRRARRSSVRRSHQRASQSQPLPTRRMTRCAAASKLQPATSPRRLRRCHCIHLR